MPQTIARARDALSNDWRESAAHFEAPAEQALVSEVRGGAVLCHTCQ